MKIYLVRHGETPLNGAKKYIGHLDEPISEKGKLQAKAISGVLSSKKIEVIYSSPLIRARETAEEISKALNDVPIVLLEGLKEIGFGKWEGKSYSEVFDCCPEFNQWLYDPAGMKIPDGEDWDDFVTRVRDAFYTVLNSDKNACIVSHGGPLRLIAGFALMPGQHGHFLGPGALILNHAGLSLLENHDGHLSVKYVNEICHLTDTCLVENL